MERWFKSNIFEFITPILLISQIHTYNQVAKLWVTSQKIFVYIGSIPIAPLGVYRLMVWPQNKNTHNTYPLISKLISIVIDRVTSTDNREVVGSSPTKDAPTHLCIFITQQVRVPMYPFALSWIFEIYFIFFIKGLYVWADLKEWNNMYVRWGRKGILWPLFLLTF